MNYNWTHDAYLKIVFHCCKYLTSRVTGLLLGSIQNEQNSVSIVDAIPLFHTPLLAPLTEIALLKIDAYAEQSDLKIVGIYTADSLIPKSDVMEVQRSLDASAVKVANKIKQHFPFAFIFDVDNNSITDSSASVPAGQILTKSEGSSIWKNEGLKQEVPFPDTLKVLLSSHFQSQTWRHLVDFESHIDDISLDYLNSKLLSGLEVLENKNK